MANEENSTCLSVGTYEPTADDKSMSLIAHLLALLTGWIGPLILYLMKKDTATPWVKLHAKQAMMWSLVIYVIVIVSIPLSFICIGYVTMAAAGVLNIVFPIIGMFKTNKGEKFLYPWVANWFCKEEIAAVYGGAEEVK